jgi:hypothetical protein
LHHQQYLLFEPPSKYLSFLKEKFNFSELLEPIEITPNDVKTQVGSLSRSLISESLIIQSKSDTAVPYDMLAGDYQSDSNSMEVDTNDDDDGDMSIVHGPILKSVTTTSAKESSGTL